MLGGDVWRWPLAEWEIGHRASCSQLLPHVPLVHSTLSVVSHGEQVFIAVPGGFQHGNRMLSVYRLTDEVMLWSITEGDRTVTTLL